MTGREIYEATINFENPPRIAMALPQPYPHDTIGGSWAGSSKTVLEPQGTELRRWRDHWGVVRASLTEYDQGEVVQGAIQDWSDLDDYTPPDMGKKSDYAAAAEKFAQDDEHFHMGGLPGFVFNIARKLRKLDNYLCDLLLERSKVDRLNEIVRNELLKAIDRWADAGAHGVGFCEDWGTQNNLMISPVMWREIFKPQFEVLAGRAHDHGMYVWMHSCGMITDIIPDLIECGVNVLQFDQPRLHGIDRLAQFAGQITFQCPVDIQTTLQTRDPKLIRSEARQLVEKLGAKGGGFIAGYYGGNQAIGLTPDIQDHACKAFVEFGG